MGLALANSVAYGGAVPVILTARLRLRGWQAGDGAALAPTMADPETVRYIGTGAPLDASEVVELVAGFEAEWPRWGHGRWAVEERGSHALIGAMGFVRFGEGKADEAAELAYTIARSHWGRGLATEAGAAALEWATARLGARRVVAVTHPENAASQRVLAKLDFERDGVFAGRYYEMAKFVWARPSTRGSLG